MTLLARVMVAAAIVVLTPNRAHAQAPAATETPCTQAIDEATTRKIFDALASSSDAGVSDGCVLESVRTEHTQTSVVWKKDAQTLPAVTLLPTSCAGADVTTPGKHISLRAPAAAAAACPTALARLKALVESDSVGTVGNRAAERPEWWGYVALALLLVVVGLVVWRLRRGGKRDPA